MAGSEESLGRVKACTHCRQQKVRCDAFRDYSQPCSRCRAAGLPCVITRDFRRKPKQTYGDIQCKRSTKLRLIDHRKAQLQHELQALKARTDNECSLGEDPATAQAFHSSSHAQYRKPKRPRHELEGAARSSSGLNVLASPTEYTKCLRSYLEVSPYLQQPLSTIKKKKARISHSSSTYERTLEGCTLSGAQVADCYSSFLDNYAPHLEDLFDHDVTANERYEQSPLLFWSMVVTGARGYHEDSTIFDRFSEHVLTLAFHSLVRPQQPLLVVQAAIVLCTWPLPVELIYKEPAHALAGAAMHIAMQNGLHMYTREQDFVVRSLKPSSRPKSYDMRSCKRINDEAVIFRTKLWASALVAFQNTTLCDGLPPLYVVPCFRRNEVYGEMSSLLPEPIVLRITLHKLQVEAINHVASFCSLESKCTESALNAVITTYDQRIREAFKPLNDVFYDFTWFCHRTAVLGLIFLAQQQPDHALALRLYEVAIATIHCAELLDQTISAFTVHMPHHSMRMLLLAAHVILRVCKSSLGESLDLVDAGKAITLCVDICKARGSGARDVYSINSVMLSQLWTSKRAYVRDGQPQNGLQVDMRYRLLFNPMFDNFWWWRNEFGHSSQITMPVCHKLDGGFPMTAANGPSDPDTDEATHPTDPQQTSTTTITSGGPGASLDFEFGDWWDFSAFPYDMLADGSTSINIFAPSTDDGMNNGAMNG